MVVMLDLGYGAEIYLCLASMFVPLETSLKYYQILQKTLNHQCLTLGYRLIKYSHDETRSYGMVLNPNKQEHIIFSENDKIIILAENFRIPDSNAMMNFQSLQKKRPTSFQIIHVK